MLHRSIAACLIAGATAGLAGCAFETGEEPRETASVDPEMLENALANQHALEEAGHHLVGRVWFAPDGYGELYEAEGGETLALFFASSGSPEAVDPALIPLEGEALEDYVTRAARGRTPRYLADVATDGTNVLVFEPRAEPAANAADGVSSTREALTNEYCPKSQFDTLCALRWGYEGSTTQRANWIVTDQSSMTFSAKGTSYNTTVCADRGSASLAVRPSGGAGITTVGVTVPQGKWGMSFQAVSMGSHERCEGFLCTDCKTVDTFKRSTIAVTATAQAGGNFHFCGRILDRGDIVTDGCDNILGGPPFRPAVDKGFLNTSGQTSVTECSKFCSATCAQVCTGLSGPGLTSCLSGCGSSCMADCP